MPSSVGGLGKLKHATRAVLLPFGRYIEFASLTNCSFAVACVPSVRSPCPLGCFFGSVMRCAEM